MADVAIYTACFGDYDQIRGQTPQDIEVEWIASTDGQVAPDPWETRFQDAFGAPNLQAKRFKTSPPLPHRFAIWIDANMEITSPSFAREALSCVNDGLALFQHPRRDCIYDEAEASLGAEGQNGKYEGLGIPEQVAHYRDEGYPEHAGLYACGTIAWDQFFGSRQGFGSNWLLECERWTCQDQLSFPVVARRMGISPGIFPFGQLERRPLGNRWLQIHPHLL